MTISQGLDTFHCTLLIWSNSKDEKLSIKHLKLVQFFTYWPMIVPFIRSRPVYRLLDNIIINWYCLLLSFLLHLNFLWQCILWWPPDNIPTICNSYCYCFCCSHFCTSINCIWQCILWWPVANFLTNQLALADWQHCIAYQTLKNNNGDDNNHTNNNNNKLS